MSKPNPREVPDIRVDDAEAAFHRLEDFTRKIMAVPKKEIDEALNRKKTHKKRRHN
jgi:hypothetical protein